MTPSKPKLLGKNGRILIDGVPMNNVEQLAGDDREGFLRSLELINQSLKLAKQRELVLAPPALIGKSPAEK